jgi:hypothetical protein
MHAKGSTLHATLHFIAADAGLPALQRILGRLPTAERERLEQARATDEVPYELLLELWRAADEVFSPEDTGWIERAGAHSIESTGVQLYGGILRKPSPLEFLTQRISLFRLYYHPGDMEVVDQGPGRAILRLVDFDAEDPLFCRRQTGGLRRAVELAGGGEPTARHVRCTLDGDAFCEWELGWAERG